MVFSKICLSKPETTILKKTEEGEQGSPAINIMSENKIPERAVLNDVLLLNSPESKENIVHIKSVAANLSKSIDVSLKLDPYKRLLLVCGLLIGINQDPNIVFNFDDRKGATVLFETIKEALPETQFDHNKRKQLGG